MEMNEIENEQKWNIVETDGNPKKTGVYDVVLIYHGWDKNTQKETEERFAELDTRWFGPADPGWVMRGQPKEGLAWHEESGSSPGETVYAWKYRSGVDGLKLPDGVKWWNEA